MTLTEVVAMLDLPTAEDVADLLRANGVTGRPGDPCCCPVATFVRGVSGRKVMVILSVGVLTLEGAVEKVDLPPAATTFLECFDADRAFGDLVTS